MPHKKNIWFDGNCIGESAPNVFFYEEATGGEQHKVTTQLEFSPNDLLVETESGQNYFVQQYIKMGAFVDGANLKLIDDTKGKQYVSKLKLAKKGTCSK